MVTLSLGWGFLVLGPLPHPDIHFVCKVSTSLWFSSAAQEELVLGSPRHGEYGNRRGLGCEGAGDLPVVKELVRRMAWGVSMGVHGQKVRGQVGQGLGCEGAEIPMDVGIWGRMG